MRRFLSPSQVGMLPGHLSVVFFFWLLVLGSVPGTAQLRQTFFVPLDETHVRDIGFAITSAAGDTTHAVISLSATANGTTVYYDHWEDGYEADLENPVQASTETFLLDAGGFVALEDDIDVNPRDPLIIEYDGRDKIGATEQIAVTRAGWRLAESTLLAGAIEVFPVIDWGQFFEFPLGEDIVSSQTFEYVAASIMAGETGAIFDIDSDGDGTVDSTITLLPGETTLVTGINTGGTIASSDPLQVKLLTGDLGSTFASRWYDLVSTEIWGSSYYSPVSSVPTSENRIFLYNPGSSSITVTHETISATVTTRTYDNTTAGTLDETVAPCGAPMVRTFTVPDTFTVNAARLGFNATHTYRGDIQVTLISPGGTSRTVIAANGGDGDDNYDVLLDGTSANPLDDGNADTTAAPFYDRSALSLIDFPGEAANGVWTLQICDSFGGDAGTFNRAQLQLDEATGTTINTGTVAVAASGITEFTVPLSSAAHFFTATGETFFATAAVDWNDTSSDWGFTLLPEEALATTIVTGWAPGRDPASGVNPTENGSPIWVTATGATDLYVDYDGDPSTGALVDSNGNRYDELVAITELESVRLFDPNDTDQNRVRVYTLDQTLIAAAWGQDAVNASAAAPAIDVGTTVVPLDALRALKEGSLLNDADGDGALGPGDTMRYTIVISNVSEAVVTGATVEDFGLDSNLTYVADSTEIDGLAIADDAIGATIFPLDEGGEPLSTIGIGESVTVTFAVQIADPLPVGVESLLNQVRVSTSTQIEVGSTLTTILAPALSITKTSNVVGDVVAGQTIEYTVTVNNISAGPARGIKILDTLPAGTTYNAESTAATGFSDVFLGTETVTDEPAGGIAFDSGSNPCGGTPVTRTFTVANSFTVSDVDLGFNADHTYRGDIQAVLESPAGTRITVLTGIADPDNNYDIVLDDESVNPLDDGTPDNTAAPFYDRDVIPNNALSGFDGETSVGTWTLEICDDAGGDSGTYNRAQLRVSGSNSAAQSRTNQAAAINPLLDGDPTNLVLAPDGFGLLPGQVMTTTYQVTVEDPLAFSTTAITNTARVTSLEQPEPLTATVVDPVTEGAAIGDRVWLDADGDGFQDVGETGIANVTVNLYDPGGDGAPGGGDDTLIGSVTTDLNGIYLFDHLPAGSYFVDVDGATLPLGLTTSPGTTDPSSVITVTAEEIRLDIDFGYTNADGGTAIVGDRVWSDFDGDGIQDPGEPGIGGATVELLDDTGSVVTTVITSDDGAYLFTGVAPGEYQVRIAASNFSGGNALDGYTVTTGPQSEGANTSDPVTLLAGDVQTDVDFGYQNVASTYSITDAVWLDVDSDGAFDPSESGIAGTTVDLLDASGDVIATTLVAADGSFSFDGVEPGSYTVSISDNSGKLIGLAGTTSAGTARQLAVTVVAADVTGQNFGYNGEALLGDRIWSDADGDGVQDENEVGLAGVTVELLDRLGAVIDTTTTDAFGDYLFDGISPNQYTVRVDATSLPAGFTQTGDPDGTLDHQSASVLTIGDADLVLDFGYRNTSLADISGNVFSDFDRDGIDDGVGEPGFTGVSLALLDSSGNVVATVKTDANGDYTFADLPAGNYTVQVTDDSGVLANHELTSGLDSVPVTLAGTDITDIDFGYARNSGTGAIGDYVWLDADRDGVQDAGESGLSGVDVDLYDVGPDGAVGGGDDVLIASTTTDANGGYIFTGIAPGAYYADVDGTTVPAGLATTSGTTDPSGIVLLSEGELIDDLDFGYGGTPGSSAIGDRVWADVDGDGIQDPGEIGIGGVSITVVGPSGTFTTTTAEDGSWLVTSLAPGTYTVTVDSSTLASAYDTAPTNGPASREYEVTSSADVLTADFGFDGATLGSIGDLVFLDKDGDGSQGVGEAGIAGVTVDLLDSGGNLVATTTTDENGAYDFMGLPAGDYQVRVSDVGQVLTGLNLSSGNNPTATINLAAGQDYNDADFPYAPSSGSGSIGSIVWNDQNGDGDRDAGESGLEGVTLALWHDINGNGVIEPGTDNLLRSTTTDENGEYEFVGLLPADYLVDVTDTSGVLTGFTKTAGAAGVNDNSQADPYAVTLTTGSPSDDTADFGYQATTPRAISGTVFGDDNSDASQNGGEAGVSGVPVILYLDLDGDGVIDPEDPQIASTTSDGSGDYAFTGLPDGRDYIVAVETTDTAVAGETQTTQTGTAGVQPVTLAGADSTGNDFGFVDSAPEVVNPAVIGDRVWLDTDGDGIQDVGEPGIPNVDLEIYDVGLDGVPGGGDDVLVATTTTGANGSYSFGGLDAGTYFVDVVGASVPTGLSTSPGTSDPSSAVTVALGDVIDTVDFGYTTTADAVVGNYVWSDADNDGQQDPGESGIGGVTVDLLSAGPDGVFGTGDDVVEAITTTTDDGWYLFTGVTAGEYRVDVTDTGTVLTGYSLTTGPQSSTDPTDPFTVAAGDVFHDADFGYGNPGLFDISDRLWQDIDGDGTQDLGESGLAGVTINLLDDSGDVIATTVTDAAGDFTFPDLPDGSYTLSVSDTGAVLREFVGTTPPATADALAVVLAGADVSAVSFGYNQPGIVGDTVFSDSDGDDVQDPGELGLGGVTVALWQDADGNGIFDSTVDTFVGNQVTAADGSYLFEGLGQGTFFASVDPSQPALTGYSATTPDQEGGANAAGVQVEATLANSAASYLAADFGFQNTALPDVSGNVFEDLDRDGVDDGAGEAGFAGVTVELRNASGTVVATAITDSSGDYTFPDVPAGNYTVAVTDGHGVLDGYLLTSSLDEVPVTVAASDITGIDFGYARDASTGSIGDRVWLDSDGDGIQDGAETGLGGVTVELYDPGPDGAVGGGDDVLVDTATTDSNGNYVFPGLGADTYYAQLDTSTLPNGGSGLVTTTADPTAIIALSEGENYRQADFGITSGPTTGAIGDRLWFDADGDGLQDPGETGIGGVEVVLTGPGCAPCTATTNADGTYLFTGLAAGDYKVNFNPATLPAIYDPNPTNTTGNIDVDGLAGGDLVTNADFGFTAAGAVGSIGDLVFLDLDGDGVLDAGEPGIEGVTVDLLDAAGTTVLASTTTDADGNYSFLGLDAGTFQVRVTDTASVLVGLNLSSGSNPTGAIVLAAGQNYVNADFGYAPSGGTGSIGNLVWHDVNGDGDRDAGESGMQGVTLELWSDTNGNGVIEPGIDNLVRTTTTDINGEYVFNGLPDGDYLVDVTDEVGVLNGFTKTSGTADTNNNSQADPYAVTVGGGSVETADFGYQAGTNFDILGTAFFDVDGNGIEDPVDFGVEEVEVYLYIDLDGDGVIDPEDPRIGTTTVDSNGNYLFEDLPDGDYVVSVDAGGTFVDGGLQTTQTLTNSVEPVVLSGADSVDNDFGFNRQATLALVTDLKAWSSGAGTVLEWQTAAEAGTAGFRVYRIEGRQPILASELVLSPAAPQGSRYRVTLAGAQGLELRVLLEELERSGVSRLYGPFQVAIEGSEPSGSRSVTKTGELQGRAFEAAPLAPDARRVQAGKSAIVPSSKVAGDRLRVIVDHDDLYVIPTATIADGLGLDFGETRRAIDQAGLRLTRAAETEVSYLPVDEGLAFVGRALRDQVYTAKEVYWLEIGPGRHMAEIAADSATPAADGSLRHHGHFEEDVFAATFVARDPNLDYWHWRGLIAGHGTYGVTDFSLALPELVPATDATLTVHFRGAGYTAVTQEHHARLSLDGQLVGETYFDDLNDHSATFELAAGVLTDGATLRVEALLDTGAPSSFFYVDSYELDFEHRTRASDERFEGSFGDTAEVTVEGFSASDLLVLDTTDPEDPAKIQNAWIDANRPTVWATFGRPVGAQSFRVQSLASAATPEVIPSFRSTLLDRSNAGAYLVIAPESLMQPAQRLADLRLADFGSSRAVSLQEIMDELAGGRFHPPAVGDFLAYAKAEWSVPPTHVALLGRGSFDYRDLQGQAADPLPPLMTSTPYGLYSSDGGYADVDGDGRPDVALGRIPAATAEEADAYIDQVIAYEASFGLWQRRVLLLADNDDMGGDFSSEIQQVASQLSPELQVETGFLGLEGVGGLRDRLTGALDRGVGLVDWMGHGGLDRLAEEGLLLSADVAQMQHVNQPIFALLSCNVARFELPGFWSLAEDLVLAESGGIAVIAPSGLALDIDSFDANQILMEELYSGGHNTLGQVFQTMIQRFVGVARLPSDPQVYMLIGDPGLRAGQSGLPGALLFADGFETGDTSRWSAQP